jgi:two-component system sensor histidine kinase RegB
MAMVAWGLRIELPIVELLMLIGITASTNFGYGWWLRRQARAGYQSSDRLRTDQPVSALLLVDVLVLTGMLYVAAGIANPFSLFYFVNVAVAGVIVTPTWAWAVWMTTVLGVTLLLTRSMPIAELSSASVLAATDRVQAVWTIPKLGFLVSFATCTGVITYFITMLTGELRQREQALKEAEDARVRNRQLEGLATLAAGAAHELASPLSTIAVVAKELGRALEKHDAPEVAKQDVVLIRSELDQCRQILDRMTSAAGEAAGERLRSVNLEEFMAETLLGIRQPNLVSVSISEDSRQVLNLLPVQAAAQAVRNLVQNAIDASSPDSRIEVTAQALNGQWRIRVSDRGHGMAPEVLARIGQPFFTTKEPGRGMGLGLYLSQNVIRRLNGQLKFESVVGQGTTAEVVLPTLRQ